MFVEYLYCLYMYSLYIQCDLYHIQMIKLRKTDFFICILLKGMEKNVTETNTLKATEIYLIIMITIKIIVTTLMVISIVIKVIISVSLGTKLRVISTPFQNCISISN